MKSPQANSISSQPIFAARWLRNSLLGTALATLLLLALWLALPGYTPHASAQTPNTATLVVQLNDHARIVRSVDFTTPISGLTALQWSGLDVVYSDTSFGPAVCAIEGVGCPATDCFCNDKYWGYNRWDGAVWQSYPVGPGGSIISQSGSIEGWRWGAFGDASASVSPTLAAEAGLVWLHGRQDAASGGYGSTGASMEILLALGANHVSAAEWRQNPISPTLASYITLNGAGYTKAAAGAAGKTAVALNAADACLPVGALTPQAYFSPTLGTYTEQSGPNSWAILGAVTISESVPSSAVTTLRDSMLAEGGWEWFPDWGADTNTTALAIQALIATGDAITSTHVISGLAYLASAQNDDGGFPYAAGDEGSSDSNSTAYVVQAIVAAGQDPNGPSWTISNSSPISYLLSMQLPDGGFEWQPGTGANQLATAQVIPALLGRAYPVAPQAIEACPALRVPSVRK